MKNRILTLLTLSPLLLCSCDSSHYKAIMMVRNNGVSTCSIRFDQFEGQYVFRIRRTKAGEGSIKFTASLEEGHMEVLYKATLMNEYSKMFEINSGESKDAYMGYLEKGYKVTIIVRSDGKAVNGSFTFDSNYNNLN